MVAKAEGMIIVAILFKQKNNYGNQIIYSRTDRSGT